MLPQTHNRTAERPALPRNGRVSVNLDAKRVKQRCEFLGIASQYSHLRRAGQQYVGLCPFHSERNPSFYVHPERKVFHCFGCGIGGDVFDFIMRAEGCDFRRALEIAARGVAAVSEGRRPERFDGGVGAKPLRVAEQPDVDSPFSRSGARERTLASIRETDRVLAAIQQTNDDHSRWLATACEPERGGPSLLESGKQL